MSLNLPSRRLLRAAAPLTTSHPPFAFLVPSYAQRRRTLFWGTVKDKINKAKDFITPNKAPKNPLTEEYLKKRRTAGQVPPTRGTLAKGSIFDNKKKAGEVSAVPRKTRHSKGKKSDRNPAIMAATLNPDPQATQQFQKKMVIREIKKRGRLSKTQALKRTERVLLSKSHDFRTSVKKLVPLAKQIAGKTVDDAIIQMRFSKKKAALEIKEHLMHAKNEAIVKRGMGLGLKTGSKSFKPVDIMTKDGARVTVKNPTTLYVDEAWCGAGLHGIEYDYRARGNVNLMKNRTTSISLVLKEEATRIRLHNEREQKAKDKKVWVQLPNRPVTGQRQYYSW